MNCELLKKIIEKKNVSRTALAEELHITRQGLYNKLEGSNEFVGSEIKKLSTVLELSDEEKNAIFFADFVDEKANRTA